MSMTKVFSRLSLHQTTFRSITTSSILAFRATPVLCAEPLKKKKKIDPQVIKHREERRRKKLEKQIRRLEKNARQLKPIDELEIPLPLIDEKKKRTRPIKPLTLEVLEQRALLEKKWSRYKMQEKVSDYQLIDRVMMAQRKAIEELRFESEQLYQEAIQPDPNMIPIEVHGPVATPPIDNYESPDGEYVNISKKWD